MSCVALWRSG